ncbi:hypothetical protein Fmac_031720 [Flemingia macrophylla]|uniref:chalcone synthase n=1 Tax=Flemingia macrophylla TaxID=520843 RepID=A0ABD1L2V6_9FABA
MASIDEIHSAQRAKGPASILAIGTAVPPNCVKQSDFTDFFFRVTNSEHKLELKKKFKRICERSMITKRYMFLTEDILRKNPNIGDFGANSLDVRQDMLVTDVPELGKEAAIKAIDEWGEPKSKISHLVFGTTSGIDMPGADFQLTKILGLSPTVKRYMIYQQGCFAGGTVLRLAKDLAENNKGARVLVVCADSITFGFRGPSENHIENLVGQSLFGDGAAALIVGSDIIPNIEKPLFQILLATQTIIPDTEKALTLHTRESGLMFYIEKEVPHIISKNLENVVREALQPLNIYDYNSMFWMVHPGGRAILDEVEAKLHLKPEKMRASRHILSEYGNMASVCVFFIMDDMRRKSKEQGLSTTGEGLDWGILFGFGPGLTVETVVLHESGHGFDSQRVQLLRGRLLARRPGGPSHQLSCGGGLGGVESQSKRGA